MTKYDLAVVIAARREEFLLPTILDVLKARRGNTQIVVIADGEWPIEPIPDLADVTLIHHPVSIGQRAACNEGIRISNSTFCMKLDAHCRLSEGFDVTLLKDMQPNWLVVPRLYNLHVFDFRCLGCGVRSYQGPKPNVCGTCQGTEFEKVMVWLPRDGQHWSCSECQEYFHSKEQPKTCPLCGASKRFKNIENRVTDSQRIDSELHFQYFRDFHPQEGLAAFIHAKGEAWIHRLLATDLATPDARRLSRMKEYVAAYEALELPAKFRLRDKAIKMLAFMRSTTHATKAGKAQTSRLLGLIELAQGHLVETMSILGACWLVRKDFYFDVLGGLDEQVGSWGQMGQEICAKVWLSGNRVICHRGVWYSHLFRTSAGFSFPYGMAPGAQQAAKEYSRNLWRNNLWPGQVYPLSHLVSRFWPVPGWSNEDLAQQKAREVGWKPRRK